MPEPHKYKISIPVVIGIIILCVAPSYYNNRALYIAILTLGSAFMVVDAMGYIHAKGYSKWLGLLILVNYIGIAILVFLPNRLKKTLSDKHK